MATIITREVGTTAKGSPLTNTEIDNNFINLNREVSYAGPSIVPSLNLDFANSKTLDPRITFSRASTGSYYDGKTTVKAEENLLSSSSLSTDYATINATLTANAAVAPDGTTTATKTVPTTANDRHISYKDGGIITLSSGQAVTYSAYFKPAGYNYAALSLSSAGNGANKTVVFDITSGVGRILTDGANLFSSMTFACTQPDANGWCRASVTAVAATSFNLGVHISACSSLITNGGPSFAGDGVSGIYVWGMQLEQRAFLTAYTPTTTSPITNYIPVLQTAASNTARIDHDPVTGECKGLLIEEQRANLLPYSENFNVGLGKEGASALDNVSIAPSGMMAATKLVESSANSYHRVYKNVTQPTAGTYTFSAYIKAAGRTKIQILEGFSVGGGCEFDLAAVTASSYAPGKNGSITPVGNGWFKVSVSWDFLANTLTYLYMTLVSGTSELYQGDGYSGVYLWGAQLEQGAFATSYIPTNLTYSGRASTATYQGDAGFLATAAVNAPRYQRNVQGGLQLLLEGAGANILVSSNNLFTNFYKQALTSSNAEVTSPAGDFTATKLADSSFGTSAEHYIESTTSTVTAGSYSMSLYVKAGNKTTFNLVAVHVGETSPTSEAKFDLVNETVTSFGQRFTSASISKAQNGWYRISAVYTLSGAAINQHGFRIRLLDGTSGVYSASAPNYCYVWGAQWEVGNGVSSYMPSVDTFTSRSSTATYFDSTGVLRNAPANAARYGYGYDAVRATWVSAGLLAEAQATNLLTYSGPNTINGWWSMFNGASLTGSYAGAPDGTQTAGRITTTTGGTIRITAATALSITPYTVSIWLKSNTTSSYNLDIEVGDTLAVRSVTVTPEWKRFSGSAIPAALGYNFMDLEALPPNADILVWGAQLEAGSVATSYISTNGSQVTRAADAISSIAGSRAADVYSAAQATRSGDDGKIAGTAFSTIFNVAENTTFAESTLIGIGRYAAYPAILSGGQHISTVGYTSSTNLRGLKSNAAGITDFDKNINTSTATNKTAIALKANDSVFSANGSISGVDTDVSVPYGEKLEFMQPLSNLVTGAAYLRKIAIYPKRLSNTELQALTAD